jgi:hypothetical protein
MRLENREHGKLGRGDAGHLRMWTYNILSSGFRLILKGIGAQPQPSRMTHAVDATPLLSLLLIPHPFMTSNEWDAMLAGLIGLIRSKA